MLRWLLDWLPRQETVLRCFDAAAVLWVALVKYFRATGQSRPEAK